jgi:hypothetical protein
MDEGMGEVCRGCNAPPARSSLDGDNALDFTEFRILPKFALILQDIGCDLRDILPVIPGYDVQGEVNARGQAARSSNLSVVDESGSFKKCTAGYCFAWPLRTSGAWWRSSRRASHTGPEPRHRCRPHMVMSSVAEFESNHAFWASVRPFCAGTTMTCGLGAVSKLYSWEP